MYKRQTVAYDSEEKAVLGAVNFEKERSDYVQVLSSDDWELTVVRNDAEGKKFLDGKFYNSDYVQDPEAVSYTHLDVYQRQV